MYTVYKTMNILNGKFYIGVHKTRNKNDKYLGSGINLKKAISKYGKENFTKEILFIFETKKDAYAKEEELVILSSNSYNLKKGGIGGFGAVAWNKGIPWSDSTKKKISLKLKGKIPSWGNTPKSKEHRQKISLKLKGKKLSEKHKKNISEGNKGKVLSKETRKKISLAQKGKARKPHTMETKQKMSEARRRRLTYYGA